MVEYGVAVSVLISLNKRVMFMSILKPNTLNILVMHVVSVIKFSKEKVILAGTGVNVLILQIYNIK